MKKKINKGVILLPIFLVLLWSCRHDSGQWKGKIERHNGVVVVKNPIDPIYGAEIFSLQEELSIGVKEGPKEYMFSALQDIDVDDDGNIYALDQR